MDRGKLMPTGRRHKLMLILPLKMDGDKMDGDAHRFPLKMDGDKMDGDAHRFPLKMDGDSRNDSGWSF